MTKALRNVIEEVWVAGDFVSPYEAIDRIIDAIDPADYEEHLRSALRLILPTITGNLRRKNLHNAIRLTEPFEGPTVETLLDPEGNEIHVKAAPYSFKIQQRRDAWTEFLNDSIVTESGQYIKLAAATIADLRFAADQRRNMADSLNNEAEKYDALANAMVDKKAESLGDLDSDDVKGLI